MSIPVSRSVSAQNAIAVVDAQELRQPTWVHSWDMFTPL